MKTTWQDEIDGFEKLHGWKVGKGDFAGVFGQAFLKAFDSDMIKEAFRATGIYPFNPNVITEKQMKPSVPYSTKGSFPMPQSSPVQAITIAHRLNPPTRIDLEEITQPIAGPSQPRLLHDTSTPTSTPSRRRRLDPEDENIDPSLLSPSKRTRLMHYELGRTASGSLLLSKPKLTSSEFKNLPSASYQHMPHLPQPDCTILDLPLNQHVTKGEMIERINHLAQSLSCAHQVIIAQESTMESANAQLVWQEFKLEKMNQTLHTKENMKKEPNTIFVNGYGVVLTSPEIEQQLMEQQARKEAERLEKEQRATNRATRKDLREALEVQWKEIKGEHERAVATWEDNCRELQAKGLAKKDLPKKPLRPRKPKMPSTEDDAEGVNGEGDGDEETDDDQ